MSVTHQKPTGVFIRLPLSDDDIRKMDLAMSERMMAHSKPTLESVSEAGMLAIGAKVDSSVPIVGYIPEKPCLTKRDGTNASTFEDREDRRHTIPLVRQSDAQAQIAALEAEVVRLREDLDASKRKNFNAGYLIACCNIYNMHNEEGIAADILREAGITEAEVKALDLNEYDAEALAVIRCAGNDDPILKGGAA